MNQSSFESPFPYRLQALRGLLKERGFDAFLVPMADAYQNEYVAPCDRRIAFLTGFTGSAAFLIVLMDRNLFFTDSRYTLQAQAQLPPGLFEVLDTAKTPPSAWMQENLLSQMVIGYDPALITAKQLERFQVAASKQKARLVPVCENPIDLLWTDRPVQPCAQVFPHEAVYAGKASVLKRHEIAEAIGKKGFTASVITDPASVAWLLNVRGDDVPYTPLPLSRAILNADGTALWFIESNKLPKGFDSITGPEVSRYDPVEFSAALKRLGEAKARILLDADTVSASVVTILNEVGASYVFGDDPCALPRACKNSTEIDGMRAAHRRDGAALVKLMAWLDARVECGEPVTELDVEAKLEAFRAEGSLYRGPSFETIAGSGPHGAVVHYRSTPETNRKIEHGDFLLLDSGGQYLDGTTDVTRTMPIGDVSGEMKDRYTRVLKGHIALANARFPRGTSGAELDVLARQYLWAAGLDYGHGTGHGVGSYLSVHDGPQQISRRNTVPLEIGMVLSNEPGYYKARHYGVRLENLQVVVELYEISSTELKMLGFEPLTLAPFDRRVILVDMLSRDETAWINAYHARVYKALCPQLDEATSAWLRAMTAAL